MYFYTSKSLSEINFDKIKPRSKKYKAFSNSQKLIDNTPMSFDIETSNGFLKDGVIYKFDKRKKSSHWENYDKVGIVYIWQFAIFDNIFYGRTPQDFIDFIDDLEYVNSDYKIIYVHNLGFEFNAILREYFEIESVFARKERHPITLKLANYNIEFRCSYHLTNLSLDNCVKEYKLNTPKLDTLDYLTIRTPKTILTKKELQYCFNDVLIITELILKYNKEYSGIYNIPLTQTGEVRRDVKKILSKNYDWIKLCHSLNSFDYDDYVKMLHVMTGGSTHASRLYVDNVITDKIMCYDFASSYPFVMLYFRYPLSKFVKTEYDKKYEDFNKYSYVVKIEFSQLECLNVNEYLSYSKALSITNYVSDNGKIVKAEKATYILTNIDMLIVRQNYTWQEINILSFEYALNDYLPSEFRQYIVNLYNDKTTLKNKKGFEDLYLKKKQKINACYGMMLTKIYNDIISYSNDDWKKETFCQKVFNKLKEEKDKKSTYNDFLPFQCGLWVTAYARYQLWQNLILPCDDLIHYYDTDSIYFSDNIVIDYVNKYNDNIPNCHKQISSQLNIDINTLSPIDVKGKLHPIGLLEKDGEYREGVYMGAKRYALRKNSGELKQTVAGVRKGSVTALKNDLHNFNNDLVYDYDESQKLIMTYNECQQKGIVWNKGEYDEYTSYNKYSNNLMPTTYSLKISDNYLKLIRYFQENYGKENV